MNRLHWKGTFLSRVSIFPYLEMKHSESALASQRRVIVTMRVQHRIVGEANDKSITEAIDHRDLNKTEINDSVLRQHTVLQSSFE